MPSNKRNDSVEKTQSAAYNKYWMLNSLSTIIPWEAIFEAVNNFGITTTIFLVVVILFIFYNFYRANTLYKQNIKDKQKQIDRLAEENREYREKFMYMLNKKLKP